MLPCLDKDLGGLYYQFNRPEVLALIPGERGDSLTWDAALAAWALL